MARYGGKLISGLVEGLVYTQDGRVWPYRKARDPKTDSQRRHRLLFAEASRLWRELELSERQLWEFHRRYLISEGFLPLHQRPYISAWHLFMKGAVRALREGRAVPRTPEETGGIRSQP